MKIRTVRALEELGRVRLSRSFFMRDFLHSEIANFYGMPNIPDDPELAIHVGKRLCEELLETLAATFGRIAIRSAYRSPTVNALGSEKGHNCSSNEKNYASQQRARHGSPGTLPGLPVIDRTRWLIAAGARSLGKVARRRVPPHAATRETQRIAS